jgi:hypothetical protein
MLKDILIIGILFIGLFYVLHLSGQTDTFIDFPVGNEFIADSQKKFSGIGTLLNPTSGITLPEADMNKALLTLKARPTATSYSLSPVVPEKFPTGPTAVALAAKACEAAPITADACAAFNDPTFATNCGVSFDINGTGINGSIHKGGMYLSPPDRVEQIKKFTEATQTTGIDPYTVFKPTLGTAERGTFAITKDNCRIVKEKVDCAAKQTFGSPNCTQCLTSRTFARVGPESGRLPATLYLRGNGNVTVSSPNNKIVYGPATLTTSPASIIIPPNTEGHTFTISVTANASPASLNGYIAGPTSRGTFKFDLMNLVQRDTVTGAKVRISGSVRIDEFKTNTMIPGSGKKSMALSCIIPFSFINMYDSDALTCDNGPVITKEASAIFLESDPCFSKANAPGSYTQECLQSRWLSLGGTEQGTGYPNTKIKADAIQKDAKGNSMSLDTIIDKLSITMTKALTGKDGNTLMTIPDWNTVSMYATGVPINTPCDGPGAGTPACASYLYLNQGALSHVGSTYTGSSSNATKKEGFDDMPPLIYNQPGTVLDPTTPTGAAFAKQFGTDINRLKNAYDSVAQIAANNSLKNSERDLQLQQAYNVKLVPMTNAVIPPLKNTLMQGRYIRLQYNRRECLNLAQIAVYSDDSISSNVITPRTTVTKSSGYSGDVYPVQNFVNGLANTFVHTSCYDVPWITVDLGSNTPIYRIVITNRKDCCLERTLGARLYIATDGVGGITYTSDEIQTVNKTYSWFPINPAVYGDLPLDSGPPPRQTVHGNNGSVSCTRYCRGLNGGPWNGELPRSWNGAKCAGYDPRIGGCDVNFPAHSGAGCICERDGRGWLNGAPW